jgi:hypothetical protein
VARQVNGENAPEAGMSRTIAAKSANEGDYRERVEPTSKKETGSRFSHGACPECFEKELKQLRGATERS